MVRTVMGVDLGGTNLRGALFSEHLDILHRLRRPTHRHEGGKAVVERLITLVQDLCGKGRLAVVARHDVQEPGQKLFGRVRFVKHLERAGDL